MQLYITHPHYISKISDWKILKAGLKLLRTKVQVAEIYLVYNLPTQYPKNDLQVGSGSLFDKVQAVYCIYLRSLKVNYCYCKISVKHFVKSAERQYICKYKLLM